MTIPDEVKQRGKTAVATFKKIMRKHGAEGYRFALMCALQSAPRIMTDTVFLEGFGTLDKQFSGCKPLLKQTVKLAKRHGYKPNVNDVYNPNLARFRGDPEAFIPATGGRGYVKALCEKRGWGNVDGAVSTREQQHEPPKPIPLAEDLIQSNIQNAIAKNPDLARKPKRELREMIVEKHGNKVTS